MNSTIKQQENKPDSYRVEIQLKVKELYELYYRRLFVFTKRNYQLKEDDAADLVYKTIYRIAEVADKYHFENENKRAAFIFKTHINYLRNYFRDTKSFEHKNFEVALNDNESAEKELTTTENPKLTLLQMFLDKMEDWERILLLMRGQDMPYSEISEFVNKPEKHLKVYYKRLKKKLLEDMNTELKKMSDGKK